MNLIINELANLAKQNKKTYQFKKLLNSYSKDEISKFINNKSDNGESILINAVCYCNIAIVKELLKIEDLDINVKTKEGNTSLMIILSKDKDLYKKMINLLMLQKNIELNVQNNKKENTLMIACRYNNLPVFKKALEKITDLDIKDEVNQSIIDIARRYVRKEMVDLILHKKEHIFVEKESVILNNKILKNKVENIYNKSKVKL